MIDREQLPPTLWPLADALERPEEGEHEPLPFMTLQQAAERVGLAPNTLEWAIRRGRLTAHRMGKKWVVYPEDVMEYLATKGSWKGGRARLRQQAAMKEAVAEREYGEASAD